jgi:hypothetical protein
MDISNKCGFCGGRIDTENLFLVVRGNEVKADGIGICLDCGKIIMVSRKGGDGE